VQALSPRSHDVDPTIHLGAAVVARGDALRQRIVDALIDGGVEVVAEGPSRHHLEVAAPSASPDVLVATRDREPKENGRGADARDSSLSEIPLVVVVADQNRSITRSALMAGAAGLVLASQLEDALCPTVLAVHAGQQVLPRDARRRATPLSYREREVLTLVISGLTNQAVGAQLCLSESTVKTHLSTVFRKLGIRSRAEAIALALDPEEAAVFGLPVRWDPSSKTAASSTDMPELQAGRN
jgi:DNA-binding NarL/FixJ family response regulator